MVIYKSQMGIGATYHKLLPYNAGLYKHQAEHCPNLVFSFHHDNQPSLIPLLSSQNISSFQSVSCSQFWISNHCMDFKNLYRYTHICMNIYIYMLTPQINTLKKFNKWWKVIKWFIMSQNLWTSNMMTILSKIQLICN